MIVIAFMLAVLGLVLLLPVALIVAAAVMAIERQWAVCAICLLAAASYAWEYRSEVRRSAAGLLQAFAMKL